MTTRPSFDDLPLQPSGPRGNAWGLHGPSDQLGALNALTPSAVAAAARDEIRDGARVSTDHPLDAVSPPCFGRAGLSHRMWQKKPRVVNDDEVTLNTQSSSQWDGLRHFGYQDEAVFYGGRTIGDLYSSDVLGIHAWANAGGIVGRGILLDYASWTEQAGRSLPPAFETSPIPASDLRLVAASQGTTIRPGDILLVRTGWGRAYAGLDDAGRAALAAMDPPPAVGLESSEETLRWLWDCGFAAVAGDQPSFEAWPCRDKRFWLHEWLLSGWGMPIGEIFDLERLAEECAKRKRWSFFFSSVPLKVPGGVASPPNGVAIF
ncbi:hypothetical protein N3K66_003742 [Trichothecium roseum]|uniref:Uncharacterized protein n=1 Tax=Trichothecium roseum TaxID=47278 RepID=A0ACC0V7P9_9HYPO|nr:hypothetical protein N3K66_003742 [Trichothecium roseum]